jgi:hypothetical protein
MRGELNQSAAAVGAVCLGCLYPHLEMGDTTATVHSASGGAHATGGATSASGGATGTNVPVATGGSTSVCTPKRATGAPALIDNLTDSSDAILTNDGRLGYWFTYNDGTGAQTPVPYVVSQQPFTATNGQACTSGSGFKTWGAGMGLSFNTSVDGQTLCTYDASRFQGVTFTLSGQVTSGQLRLIVKMAATTPPQYGGTCVPPAGTSVSSYCDSQYNIKLAPTATPQFVQVKFSQLAQDSWGLRATWDPTTLIGLNWEVSLASSTDATFSNVCVDDVSFF